MAGRVSREDYYLDIALAVSKRSACLKRRYGCIIVKNDEIIATGYNGSPRGELNCCDIGICKRKNIPHNSGDYSDCHSVHAEQNAMLSAPREQMIGATLYLAGEEYVDVDVDEKCDKSIILDWCNIKGPAPCPICARMIMNAGITEVKNNIGSLVLRKLV